MINGWQTVELGKVMQLEIDAVPVDSQSEFQMAGVYSFARGLFKRESLPNTQTTYKFFHRLHKDMFVISVPKGWEGALARVTDNFDGMFLSPVFPTFRANSRELDIRYFEWYCRQPKIWDELRRKSRGIGARRESISAEKFLSIEIPLPSLDEQRRIVMHVDAIAARIAKAQSLREAAEQETELFLKSCLSSIFDYQYGDELPNGWEWKSFNQTLEQDGMRTGPFGTALNNSEIYTEGIPVFGIPNVGHSVFRPGFTDYITAEKAKALSVYVLEEGDIAIARSGTVGRSCIVPKLDPKPIMSSNLIRIRINKKVFLPDLMCQILTGSKLVERHIDKECRGSTRIFFTQKILNKFQIPVPPLDEQRRIMAYLDSVQARLASLRELQSATGEELSALLPSVLDKAFKGEL